MIALSGWLTWHAKIEKGEAIFPCYFPRACLSLEWGLWHVGLVDCTDRSQLVGTLSTKHTLTPVRHRFRGQVSFALLMLIIAILRSGHKSLKNWEGRREENRLIRFRQECGVPYCGMVGFFSHSLQTCAKTAKSHQLIHEFKVLCIKSRKRFPCCYRVLVTQVKLGSSAADPQLFSPTLTCWPVSPGGFRI